MLGRAQELLPSLLLCCVHSLVTGEYVNLGLVYRRSVTQSSTLNDYRARNAVDNNTDQRVGQGSCSHTRANQSPAWWRIQFTGSVHIDQIRIYHRDEGL
ncbi:hypothetical protein ScPMuIL_000822 [Solemya velum]